MNFRVIVRIHPWSEADRPGQRLLAFRGGRAGSETGLNVWLVPCSPVLLELYERTSNSR